MQNIALSGKMWTRRNENKITMSGMGGKNWEKDPVPKSSLVQETSLSS